MYRVLRFNIGRYSPLYLDPSAKDAARNYFTSLNKIGLKALSLVLAASTLNPNPILATLVAIAFLTWSYLKGGQYRSNLKSILAYYNSWRIILVPLHAWAFILAVLVIDALFVQLISLEQIASIKATIISVVPIRK